MKNLSKCLLFIIPVIFIVFFVDVICGIVSVYAWGDNTKGGKGRPSRTIDEINQGVLGDKIIFNTISDSPMGDEKNFVAARENTGVNIGKDNVWEANDINVENGKEYIVRLYVHNNNPKGMDAVAEDVHVALSLPHESAKDLQINGFIRSSNATPTEYWDYVNLHSDTAFHLEYIGGSGLLENNGIGSVEGGLQLSDDVVKAASGGTLIGYDALDGRIPGCYQYDAYITIRVKVVYDTSYTVTNQVRIKSDSDKTWKDIVDAKIGDVLEYRIEYRNYSNELHRRVVIRSVLCENLNYIKDSTELVNSSHPNGARVNSDAVVGTGIVVGDYNPMSNVIVYFEAKIVDECLTYGANTMTSWGRASVDQTVLHDWAQVRVQKENKNVIDKNVMSIIVVFSIITMMCFGAIIYQCRKIRHLQQRLLELENNRK